MLVYLGCGDNMFCYYDVLWGMGVFNVLLYIVLVMYSLYDCSEALLEHL